MTKTNDKMIGHVAEIDVTMLIRRLDAARAQQVPAEVVLKDTAADVIALVPLAKRVPAKNGGSLYQEIADGIIDARQADSMMDRLLVCHTAYAGQWLAHAIYEQIGHSRAAISFAEVMGMA